MGIYPWGIGVEALLNKDASSLAETRKMSIWMKVTHGNVESMNAGYTLNGDKIESGNYLSTFFASPFGVAAMTGGSHNNNG